MLRLRAKSYSYLIDTSSENRKKQKVQKSVMKRELKFQDYKNCLNAAKIDGKIKYLEKKKYNVDKLKEFVKNKAMLKKQRRFKSERHNVFTEAIHKIALSTNDDKRIQSTDPIKTHACFYMYL